MIDLDDESTWPTEILDRLESDRIIIANYKREDDAIQRTPDAKAKKNRYWSDYHDLSNTYTELMKGHTILGWHATRLTWAQRVMIKWMGLLAPSPYTVFVRMTLLVLTGSIDPISAIKIIKNNHSGYSSRRNLTYFSYRRSSLRSESNRYFFGWLGGEVIHDYKLVIGKPTLVKIEVSCSRIFQVGDVLKRYLSNENEVPDGSVAGGIRGVLDVIPSTNPQFEELTGYSKWRRDLE